jgi:hypothetical protein
LDCDSLPAAPHAGCSLVVVLRQPVHHMCMTFVLRRSASLMSWCVWWSGVQVPPWALLVPLEAHPVRCSALAPMSALSWQLQGTA